MLLRARVLCSGASERPVMWAALFIAFLLPLSASAQSRCGVQRWPVKTLADRDAARVDTIATPTSIAELAHIPRPDGPFQRDERTAPVELTRVLVRARIARILPEQDDLDIHLVLRDLDIDSITVVAEIPDSLCAPTPALGRAYNDARRALRRVPRDGVVEVVGIGFFDSQHGQSGMADNGIEIHPILSLRPLSEPARDTSDATGQCRNGSYTRTAALGTACARAGGLALWWGLRGAGALRPPLASALAGEADPPSDQGRRTEQIEVSSDTVWINTNSEVYHCRGSATYGNTARGRYATEAEAVRDGARPAGGRRCANDER